MPDLLGALAPFRRRFQIASLAAAVALGAVAGALATVTLTMLGVSSDTGRAISASIALLCGSVTGLHWWKTWTPACVAAAVEARVSGLDNLVVTAEAVGRGGRRPLHPVLQTELGAQAIERLQRTSPAMVRPLAASVTVAIGALVGFVTLLVAFAVPPRESPSNRTAQASPAEPLGPGDIRVLITAPAYAQRAAVATVNPTTVVALEGSRVRIETLEDVETTRVIEADLSVTPFVRDGGRMVHEFVATASRALVIQFGSAGANADRLLHLRVDPDARPAVRIRQPAKDLVFGEPAGRVPIEIEARDDLALKSVTLRFTKVAGSGESFTFEEGELPLQVARTGAGDWTASGVITLEGLGLQDGDTVVYRAMAADYKPGADPSNSDTYLIEVGRLAGVASTGFALPDDRDRQAISQQMLIIKTERLHEQRGKLSDEAFAEQSRLLAIEQRMVKAEFVFMTGGEVADEIEEATHAHELAEGRLENAGQVELLVAIREMSRAEARLNDADTTVGLEFERAALKALQRAFDRRRYLLRTLPERARIDTTRRLTGELGEARSSSQAPTKVSHDPTLVRAREVLRSMAVLNGTAPDTPAAIASRIMSVDPSSEALQKVALQFVAARDEAARKTAAAEAQKLLLDIVRSRLPAGASDRVPFQPLQGRVADELSKNWRRQ